MKAPAAALKAMPMVQSKATTVDDYLRQVSTERGAVLARIRNLARASLHDHEETMQWGMPVYVRSGAASFGFAEQKNYISLYFINPAGLNKNADAVARLRSGKNCLRLRKSTRPDWSLVERLLVDTREAPRPTPSSSGHR